MARLPLITAPDPLLKTVSKPVEAVTPELRKLMDDMVETMYGDFGIGLAAVQVGIPKRIIVMDLAEEGEQPSPRYFVNPEILWTSDETATYNEGCLSVPDHYADVERPARCRVKFVDYHGKPREAEADGLLATCIQHEVDHLNGVLFIDRISGLKRKMILKKLTKTQREKLAAHTL